MKKFIGITLGIVVLVSLSFAFGNGTANGFNTHSELVSEESRDLIKMLLFLGGYFTGIVSAVSLLLYSFYDTFRQNKLIETKEEAEKKIEEIVGNSIEININDELEKINEELKRR